MVDRSYISPHEVRRTLRSLYRNDAESNLQTALLALLSDGLKPVDDKGRWKPNPVLILIAVLIAVLAGGFLYFSVGGSS